MKCDEYCGELLITHQDPPGASLTGDQLPGPVLGLGHEVPVLAKTVLVRVALVVVRLPPHYWLSVLLPSLKRSQVNGLQILNDLLLRSYLSKELDPNPAASDGFHHSKDFNIKNCC